MVAIAVIKKAETVMKYFPLAYALLITMIMTGCGNRYESEVAPDSPEGFVPYMEQLSSQIRGFNPCGSTPRAKETEFSATVTGGANTRRGLIVDQRATTVTRGTC